MYQAEDLEVAISSFISENRAFLSTTSAAPQRSPNEAPASEDTPTAPSTVSPSGKYIAIMQMEHTAARNELLKATELLQESLREWSHERKAHQETKQLLQLALQELRDGSAVRSAGFPAAGGHSALFDSAASPSGRSVQQTLYTRQQQQQQVAADHQSRQQSSGGQSPLWFHTASSGGSTGSRMLESMLMQAAPTMIDDGGDVSPVGRTPTRLHGAEGFSSPYGADVQRRLQRALQLDQSVTPTYHKPRAATPPFQSGAARFRDMVPAGDQLIYETRSGNSVGLQYKKSSDIKQQMQRRSGGGDAPLTAYALRARTAVEDLQRRLTQQSTRDQQVMQQPQYNPATPNRKGNVTLYSPR
jgi:hypothetical protein